MEFLKLLSAAAVSAVFGVAAWVATNFVAEPLLHFYRQRRAIRESLFFTRNVDKGWERQLIIDAVNELRRHAASMEALSATAPNFVKKHLARRGFDMTAASSALTGLSNGFGSPDGERMILRDALERALKFPRSHTDTEIAGIRDRLDRGGNRVVWVMSPASCRGRIFFAAGVLG